MLVPPQPLPRTERRRHARPSDVREFPSGPCGSACPTARTLAAISVVRQRMCVCAVCQTRADPVTLPVDGFDRTRILGCMVALTPDVLMLVELISLLPMSGLERTDVTRRDVLMAGRRLCTPASVLGAGRSNRPSARGRLCAGHGDASMTSWYSPDRTLFHSVVRRPVASPEGSRKGVRLQNDSGIRLVVIYWVIER